MRPPLNSETKPFWEKIYTWKVKYPFWCCRPTAGVVWEVLSNPHPECGRWYRIVWGNYSYVGFTSKDGRDAFCRTYTCDLWSP
jgi:hypothetical protein